MEQEKFKHIILGGTFDRLHPGHEKLINAAIALGEKISIGLSSGELLVNKTLGNLIRPFEERRSGILDYVKETHGDVDIQIYPISDRFGGADIRDDFDAIIISEEPSVVANTVTLNKERKKNGLKSLCVIKLMMVLDESGKRYSSTTMRECDNGN